MQCVDRRGLYYPTARTVAMVTLASCMITRLATSFEGAHAQRPRSPGAPVRLQRGVRHKERRASALRQAAEAQALTTRLQLLVLTPVPLQSHQAYANHRRA